MGPLFNAGEDMTKTAIKPAQSVKPIPAGYHTMTASLILKDLAKAIEFYKKAIGAEEAEVCACEETGKIMHAELKVGDSRFMMCEENAAWGCMSAETFKGTPVSFYLYVNDCDASFKKAIDAGAKAKMPLDEMFWGDRVGSVTDPFGYQWTFATRKHDYTKEEIKAGQKAFVEKMKAMKKPC